MLDLMRVLSIPKCTAVGILECLWHWTAKYAPRGDVGRFSDGAISAGAGWNGDATSLVESLVACRWLDKSEQVRLVVHDWSDHADGGVQKYLSRNSLSVYKGIQTSLDKSGQVLPAPCPLPLAPCPLPLAPNTSPDKSGQRAKRPRAIPFDYMSILSEDAPAEFREAWQDWGKHRSEVGSPPGKHRLTATQAEKQLKMLDHYGVQGAIKVIQHTITSGWIGLRAPDGMVQPEPAGAESERDVRT